MSKTERALDELDTEFDDEFELELDMDAPDRALDRYDADDIDHDVDELGDDELEVADAETGDVEIDEVGDVADADDEFDDLLDDVDSTNGHHDADDGDVPDVVESADESPGLGDLLVDTRVEIDDDPDAELDPVDDEFVENRQDTDPDTDVDVDPDTELETVTDDILEELRRADIDGPLVEMAPQDDTTSARRRPKRALDFDPAPMPIPTSAPLLLGRKPRVRKVTRVVRHVDPWSVFKIAAIANLVLYVILLTAGVLLWNVANATGTVDNVERFFESFGWDTFEFNGGEIYHAAWIGGLFLVVGFTGLAVLAATLFNLITDLVGGMRLTVLEEEVVETRTSPMRRFVVRRPEPVVPAVVHDDESGPMIREAVVDDESKGLPF